jgi:hypothetical protein
VVDVVVFDRTSVIRRVLCILVEVARVDADFDVLWMTVRFQCYVAVRDGAHFALGVVSSSVSTAGVDVSCGFVEAFKERP